MLNVKTKGQVEADRRFAGGVVQHVYPALPWPASHRPGNESHRRRVPQPTAQVSVAHQLLHDRLVPGTHNTFQSINQSIKVFQSGLSGTATARSTAGVSVSNRSHETIDRIDVDVFSVSHYSVITCLSQSWMFSSVVHTSRTNILRITGILPHCGATCCYLLALHRRNLTV